MIRTATIALALGLLASEGLPAQDTGADWMELMARSVQTRSYQGAFVRVHSDDLEVMEIFHRVDEDGQVRERLVSLDGAGREILSEDGQVRCYLPDKRRVLVEPGRGEPLLASLPGISRGTPEHYRVDVCGACADCSACPDVDQDSRLLSRDTVLLAVSPRDGFRYGYRLWLDRQSQLPLQTQVLDEGGKPIEQIRFTRLAVDAPVEMTAVSTTIQAADFQWIRTSNAQDDPSVVAHWQARFLPPGFTLVRARHEEAATGRQDHMVFEDGMVSVSVFVEPVAASGMTPGLARRGLASAFTVEKDGYFITAVGEVPAITVEGIARGMEGAGDH